MGVADHLTFLLRSLLRSQKAVGRISHRTTERFKTGKENDNVYIVTWLFNLYVEYIIQYAGLNKSQLGIKIAGTSNIHRYEDDPALRAESKKELKSLSMRRGDEKISLNSTFKKLFTERHSTFMASIPTTSCHIEVGTVETVADFTFLGSKITMDLDGSDKIKTHLLTGRKKGYEKPAQCIKK